MRKVASATRATASTTCLRTPAIKQPTSARPRLLVVRDNASIGRYLGQLRAQRFEVDVLAHGEDLITAVLARRHDAIIMEQCECAEAGWTLLHVIREYLARRDLPMVVIGWTTKDPSSEQRWRAYGVARVFERDGVSGSAVVRYMQELLGLAAPRAGQAFGQEPYVVPGATPAMNPTSTLRFEPVVPAKPATTLTLSAQHVPA